MAKLQLDADSSTTIDQLADILGENVTLRIVAKVGPAGGNPLIELTGDRAELERICTDGWGDTYLTEHIID